MEYFLTPDLITNSLTLLGAIGFFFLGAQALRILNDR
jgi:hypothetical protein